jgi:hypothetical protein
MGQVDAMAQSSVQQQLAAPRQEAVAIDSNSVTSCHRLTQEGSRFDPQLAQSNSVAALLAQQTTRSSSEARTLIARRRDRRFLIARLYRETMTL